MVTAAQIRELALALPETEEKAHFGQPDFRVKGKIFAGVSPDGTRGTLKLMPEMQAGLLESSPNTFSPCAGAWGKAGWTFVDLKHAKVSELQFLLEQAWRLTAPKRVLAAYDRG